MATKARLQSVGDVLDAKDGETLHQAMAMAFAEIETATKSAENPFFKSKYADLGAIIGTVKPALVNHRLFFTQHCHPSADGVIVETVLHHANGESLSMGQLYVPANKHDPQGFGSAQTYARRYALQTAFGVPTEDDDGNAGTRTLNKDKDKDNGTITDDQWTALEAKAEAIGADKVKLAAYLGASSLRELPAERYADALEALETKARKHPVESAK